MIKKTCGLIFLILLLPALSHAGLRTITGKELLNDCQIAMDIYDKNSGRVQIESEYVLGMKSGICHGYLSSINDWYFSPANAKGKHNAACSSDNYTLLEEIAVVVKYLKNHPEQLDMPASRLVVRAFEMYFPCKR